MALVKKLVQKYPTFFDKVEFSGIPERSHKKTYEIVKRDPMSGEFIIFNNPSGMENINPFYLHSPYYIPVIILLIFIFLILKKKIKSGWTRLITILSFLWIIIAIVYSYLLIDYRHYNDAIKEIPENIQNVALFTIIPIALLFFLGWGMGWIRQGFKEKK